jgi:hypothetical protein
MMSMNIACLADKDRLLKTMRCNQLQHSYVSTNLFAGKVLKLVAESRHLDQGLHPGVEKFKLKPLDHGSLELHFTSPAHNLLSAY